MKHKHYDLIIAWANGARIEARLNGGEWHELTTPAWNGIDTEYRIKTEPKHDFYTYLTVTHSYTGTQTLCWYGSDNVKFTYDGETRKLKSAEVI
jgi:hypothetical protein